MAIPIVSEVGVRYGRLVVLEREFGARTKILCRCDCGTEKRILFHNLRSGTTKSCGCLRHEPTPNPVVSEIGARYGRLEVIERAAGWRTKILCRCDCGTEKRIVFGDLLKRRGHTSSCGCLRVEQSTLNGLAAATHGRSRTPEYSCWRALRTRCFNPKTPGYKDYGGRGITVCERWRSSFENFFEDMGERPGPEYSIDRIDNSGNYEKNNCRWATPVEQSRNQRPKRPRRKREL